MQVIQHENDGLHQENVANGKTAIFRAKPDVTSSVMPNDLSRHGFQRISYLQTAYGVKTIELTDYQTMLTQAVENISGVPEQFKIVRSVMTSPTFILAIQKEVWPKPEATLKVGVRSLEESDIERMVRANIAKAKINGVSEEVRRVVIAILGVACEHAGLVKLRMHSFTTDVYNVLFPTWGYVRTEAVKMLAWEHFKKIDLKRGIETKSVARIALAPLAHLFDDITQVVDKIISERNQFDALAAAAAARVFRRGDFLGDYKGITDESEVIEFAENATLMLGYLDDVTAKGSVLDDAFFLSEVSKIPLTSFGRRLAAAATTIRNIEHIRTAPIDVMTRNTEITHLRDYRGGLSGVVINPSYTFGKPEFMVSELVSNTIGRNLLQQSSIEDDINAIMVPVNDMVNSFPKKIAFVMQNITEEYDANVALDIAASDTVMDSEGNITQVSDIIYPLCVALGISDRYMQLLAVAQAMNVSIKSRGLNDSAEAGYDISFVFDVKQPDVHRILPMVSEGVSFSDKPEVVVAFGTNSFENASNWEIANQNISKTARSMRYVGPLLTRDDKSMSIIGDDQNYLDRKMDLEFKVSVPGAGADGGPMTKEFKLESNFYTLFTAMEFVAADNSDHVYVHYMPAVVAKTRAMFDLYIHLNDTLPDRDMVITSRDRIITMLVDTLAPFIRSPRFKSLVAQVRANALLEIYSSLGDDRVAKNSIRRLLISGEMDVDISSAVLLNLLRRVHLLGRDQQTALNDISITKRFREAMLSVVI